MVESRVVHCPRLTTAIMCVVSGLLVLPSGCGTSSHGSAWLASPSTPSTAPVTSPAPSAPTVFAGEEPVTIVGYTGTSAEDPTISPDGLYLFFDSHNDAGQPQYLFWATRIDYKTFQFMGEVQGVNQTGAITLRGNYDLANEFYFVSQTLANATQAVAIGRGVFQNGVVTAVAAVEGLAPSSPPQQGYVNAVFDLWISLDGQTIYYTDATVNSTTGVPVSSVISIATRNPDGTFTRRSDSDQLLGNVNALGIVYNSAPTPDGLELVFTCASNPPVGTVNVYSATRATTSDPFGTPRLLAAADAHSFPEDGAVSPDGQHLYIHRVVSSTTSGLWVLTRQ